MEKLPVHEIKPAITPSQEGIIERALFSATQVARREQRYLHLAAEIQLASKEWEHGYGWVASEEQAVIAQSIGIIDSHINTHFLEHGHHLSSAQIEYQLRHKLQFEPDTPGLHDAVVFLEALRAQESNNQSESINH